MEFSYDEKVACIFTLMLIAESDGPKTYEEICLLADLDQVFGVTYDEMLQGITFEAARCGMDNATRILKPMSYKKKVILEDAMTKMMEVDPVNDNKLGAWWGAQMAFELPRWIKTKNDSLNC